MSAQDFPDLGLGRPVRHARDQAGDGRPFTTPGEHADRVGNHLLGQVYRASGETSLETLA